MKCVTLDQELEGRRGVVQSPSLVDPEKACPKGT